MRPTDDEYLALIRQIDAAPVLDLRILEALSRFHHECDIRCLEAMMGKRSRRSARASTLLWLVHRLDKRHQCRLVYRGCDQPYTRHEPGYHPFQWANS